MLYGVPIAGHLAINLSGAMTGKTVLLVDENLGFLFWLGRLLAQAGYDPLPAKDVVGASQLLKETGARIDVLVVQGSCPGAAGLAEDLRRTQPDLKFIAALGPHEDANSAPASADAIERKCLTLDVAAALQWLDAIRRVCKQ